MRSLDSHRRYFAEVALIEIWPKVRLAVICLALAPLVLAQSTDTPGATEFVRVARNTDGKPAALQLAIVTYVPVHEPSKYSVDLIGAVHVGDQSYYEELNSRFTEYDALLYELVIREGAGEVEPGSESKGILSNTQLMLGNFLDLTFQLEHIDYRQPNFVHADLTARELRESMSDKGESLYVYFWRIYFASMKEYAKDPLGVNDLAAMLAAGENYDLKTRFAYELAGVTEVGDFLGGESGSAIISARNERALQVLRQQLDTDRRRFGIFYGVAHLPDIEQRLIQEFGLVRDKTVWIDAWNLRPDTGETVQ